MNTDGVLGKWDTRNGKPTQSVQLVIDTQARIKHHAKTEGRSRRRIAYLLALKLGQLYGFTVRYAREEQQ